MQPAAGQNDQGLPGSIAAKGSEVWVTGTFLGGFSNVGYFNHSTTAGASWVLDGPGTENDVYECDGTQKAPAPIGLNSEGNDHRLYAIRRDFSGSVFTYKWGGATWVDGLGGTCASHLAHLAVGNASTLANDSLHLSAEKRKLPRTRRARLLLVQQQRARRDPCGPPDTIYCDTAAGPPAHRDRGPSTARSARGRTTGRTRRSAPPAPRASDLASRRSPAPATSSAPAPSGARPTAGRATSSGWGPQLHGHGRPLRHRAGPRAAVAFGSGSGLAYSLRRQETRLQDWANCVAKTDTCRITTSSSSASLVADDRVEIGYAYDDSPFLHSTSGNGAALPVLRIDGTTTSATRNITLTAVGPNRHYGLPGTGVVLDAEIQHRRRRVDLRRPRDRGVAGDQGGQRGDRPRDRPSGRRRRATSSTSATTSSTTSGATASTSTRPPTPTCCWRPTSSTHRRSRRLPRSHAALLVRAGPGPQQHRLRRRPAATASCFKGVGGVGSDTRASSSPTTSATRWTAAPRRSSTSPTPTRPTAGPT